MVVGAEFIGLAVERELRMSDAIAIAPDDRAHVGFVIGEVAVEGAIAEDDVAGFAATVGRFDVDDVGTPGDDLDGEGLIFEGVEVDGLAVGSLAEGRAGD